MSESKNLYRIKKKISGDTFAVPQKLISRLAEAGENDLKLFLIIASLAQNEPFELDALTAELEKAGVPEDSLAEGMAFLRGAGLIEKASAKKAEKPEPKKEEQTEPVGSKPSARPSYTSKQLAEEAEKGPFKELVDWASMRLGKMFNPSELGMLFSFKDYLCLPEDVIMLAIEHCATEGKPSLRYIEKMLIDFADRGINTYQKAENYILNRKKYLTFEASIRRLMGMGERSLSTAERSVISSWQEWQMSDELIRLAYDKTIDRTKKPSIKYMHTILENWHTLGFKTARDVETGDKKPSSTAFDPDDFFKTALESSKR